MKKIGLERQRFSEEFKQAMLKLVVEGQLTAVEVCREYGVSRTSMYRWLNSLSTNNNNLDQSKASNLSKSESEKSKIELLNQRIAMLEKSLDREKLRSEAYETMIEIAEKEFRIQIGKKSGAKQSKK